MEILNEEKGYLVLTKTRTPSRTHFQLNLRFTPLVVLVPPSLFLTTAYQVPYNHLF